MRFSSRAGALIQIGQCVDSAHPLAIGRGIHNTAKNRRPGQ
jgi:hypothetical protein